MKLLPAAGLGVAVALGSFASASAKTFADNLQSPLERPLARALAESIGRSLPVISASSGFVFRFDPESGAFIRETTVLGQLFLERADPIGRGKWNLNVSYQRVETDTFEGKDLRDLSDTRFPILDRPNDPRSPRFRVPLFAIDLKTDEVTASATYGVTDDLDVNLTVPVLYSAFGLDVLLRSPQGGEESDHVRSSKLGVGDILLRGKYRALAQEWAHAALGIVLRVPTGSRDNFQGTGAVELAPMLYLSREAWILGSWLKLRPYLNGGVDFNTEDVDGSEARWGFGLDAGISDRAAAAVAVLGRHPFRGIGPPGFLDRVRVDPATGRRFTAPLFGIEDGRPDFFDLSVGGRVSLWRERVIGFVDAIVPLNDDGFRSTVIPLVGIEAVF